MDRRRPRHRAERGATGQGPRARQRAGHRRRARGRPARAAPGRGPAAVDHLRRRPSPAQRRLRAVAARPRRLSAPRRRRGGVRYLARPGPPAPRLRVLPLAHRGPRGRGPLRRAAPLDVIEVLVCDFGGVLTTPLEASFRYWSEASGVPLEDLGGAVQRLAERDGAHPLHLLERGELSEADFLGAISRELGGVDMSGFTETYFEHLDVNTELLDRLRTWRSDGLRMAMCTNNVREWEPRWRAMVPVDQLFEAVIDSAFVGVRKPEPRIYEIVLERMGGVDPGACVLLDDFESNCEGARALGMHAVRFATTEQAIADLEALLDGRGGDG